MNEGRQRGRCPLLMALLVGVTALAPLMPVRAAPGGPNPSSRILPEGEAEAIANQAPDGVGEVASRNARTMGSSSLVEDGPPRPQEAPAAQSRAFLAEIEHQLQEFNLLPSFDDKVSPEGYTMDTLLVYSRIIIEVGKLKTWLDFLEPYIPGLNADTVYSNTLWFLKHLVKPIPFVSIHDDVPVPDHLIIRDKIEQFVPLPDIEKPTLTTIPAQHNPALIDLTLRKYPNLVTFFQTYLPFIRFQAVSVEEKSAKSTDIGVINPMTSSVVLSPFSLLSDILRGLTKSGLEFLGVPEVLTNAEIITKNLEYLFNFFSPVRVIEGGKLTEADNRVDASKESAEAKLPPGVYHVTPFDPVTVGTNAALFVLWNTVFWALLLPTLGLENILDPDYSDYYDYYDDLADELEPPGDEEGEAEGEEAAAADGEEPVEGGEDEGGSRKDVYVNYHHYQHPYYPKRPPVYRYPH